MIACGLPVALPSAAGSVIRDRRPARKNPLKAASAKGDHSRAAPPARSALPASNLYTDMMNMAPSTEVRVPLLDDEVVGLSGSSPVKPKLRRLPRNNVFTRIRARLVLQLWRQTFLDRTGEPRAPGTEALADR